ncbi:MAG: hypothetical protein ACYSWR_00810 [Planctomycetota bacterium]|jgi:hypothetical protein
MLELTEHFANGKMIVTHPTGVVNEYDEEDLQKQFEAAERDRDEANEKLGRVNYQIELLRGSK